MSKDNKNSLINQAKKISRPGQLSIPLETLLEEAVQVADFLTRYWEPRGSVPGMRSAAPHIDKATAEELLSLRRAVHEAHERYLLAQKEHLGTRELAGRARFLSRELDHMLEWALRGKKSERGFRLVKKVKREAQRETKGVSSLVRQLTGFAALARENLPLLEKVPDFDPAVLAEIDEIAPRLVGIRRGRPRKDRDGQQALLLRRQLAHLLKEKIGLVRSAARFVYRNHPEIVKQVTSAYERKRRRAQRNPKQ